MLRENHVIDFGKQPLTVKFMKGAYRLKPPNTKYRTIWDIHTVLGKLELIDNVGCSFKQLTHKCVMLLALASGQRVQTLVALTLSAMKRIPGKLLFGFHQLLKTSRPGSNDMIDICTFVNAKLCPVACLEAYF